MNRYIYFIVTFLCLSPWLFMQLSYRIPGDAAFLMNAAEHILNGHNMSDYYFDNNPPMSYLIYIPAVLLKYAGVPGYLCVTLYTLIIIGLCAVCMHYLLKIIFPKSNDSKNIALAFYLLTVTIPFIMEFGQKDHLILITIIPFVMMQYLITKNTKHQNLLSIFTLAFLTPFILIKPHFGLLPVALLLHRAVIKKNINIALDQDFIILSIGTVSYITYTYFYMNDFITEVLPLSVSIYAKTILIPELDPTKPTLAIIGFAGCMIGILHLSNKSSPQLREVTLLFLYMLPLSAIAFFVQQKGFSIHFIPTFGLLVFSSTLIVYLTLKSLSELGMSTTKNSLLVIVTSICLYAYISYGLLSQRIIMTHNDYKTSELIEIIEQDKNSDTFFIEDGTTSLNYTSAFYTDKKVGSRFPSVWFIPFALKLKDENKRIETLDKLGKYISADIEEHKPSPLIFMLNNDGKSALSIIYKNHPQFQEALSKYKLSKTKTISNEFRKYRDDLDIKKKQTYEEIKNKSLTFEIYTRIE